MTTLDAVLASLNQLAPHERQTIYQYLHQHPELRMDEPQGKPTRILGLHAHLGPAWLSDDFHDPLPDSFWFSEGTE